MKKYISLAVSLFIMITASLIAFNAFAQEGEAPEPKVLTAENTSVVLSTVSYNYNGSAKTPNASVFYIDSVTGEKIQLVKNTDFTISYKNNINAGTAVAEINGTGDYSGSVTADYTIKPISISKSEIALGYNTTVFSGNPKTPTPTVYWINGKEKVLLKKGKDYTVKYNNNTNTGKASAVITGINNFNSSVTKYFKIIPQQVTGVKLTGSDTSSVTIKWNKQSYVSGYKIYRYNGSSKTYKLVATVSAKYNTYTLKNLNPGTAQLIKVRAYKKIDDSTNYYGAYSSVVKYATKPARVVLTSVGKSGSSKIKVSWNKVKCTGYQVFYSTDKNFKKNVKNVFIKNANATSYTISKINNKKKYYVKVRAYLNYNDKRFYGTSSQYLSTYYNNLYATYYSYYENNPNRTNNLRIASKAISGKIVQPGETFSFNKVVGPRTTAKGYKDAHIFSGDGVVDGTGGGVCQVASTMFNCALLANVGIVERHQHSQRVAYVPLGRDAAIYGTAEDFKWKNTTKYPIKVVMTVKDGKITCSFYTCENTSPKKVSLKVTQSGKNFTLKRYVGGKINYSCKSNY